MPKCKNPLRIFGEKIVNEEPPYCTGVNLPHLWAMNWCGLVFARFVQLGCQDYHHEPCVEVHSKRYASCMMCP